MKSSPEKIIVNIEKIEDICDSRIAYNLSLLRLLKSDKESFKLLLRFILNSSKLKRVYNLTRDDNILDLIVECFAVSINGDLDSYEEIKSICVKIKENTSEPQLNIDYLNFYLKSTILVDQKVDVYVQLPDDFLETDYFYDIFNLSKELISSQQKEILNIVGKTVNSAKSGETPRHYHNLLIEVITLFNTNKETIAKYKDKDKVHELNTQLKKIIDIYKNQEKYLKDSIAFNNNKDVELYNNPYHYAYPWRLLIELKIILADIKINLTIDNNCNKKNQDLTFKGQSNDEINIAKPREEEEVKFPEVLTKDIDTDIKAKSISKEIIKSSSQVKIEQSNADLVMQESNNKVNFVSKYVKENLSSKVQPDIGSKNQEISPYAKILINLDSDYKDLIKKMYSGNFSSNAITCKTLCQLAEKTGAKVVNSSGTTIKITWNKKTLHLSNMDDLLDNSVTDQTFSLHKNKNSKYGLQKFYVNQFLQAFSVIFTDNLAKELDINNWEDFCFARTKKFSSGDVNTVSKAKQKKKIKKLK